MAEPMPAAEKIDIHYVANLARLSLTEEEAQRFQEQLEHILGYFQQIRELDVSSVEPMAHAIQVQNVFRKDEVVPSLDKEAALNNAPAKIQDLFMVPKIVE